VWTLLQIVTSILYRSRSWYKTCCGVYFKVMGCSRKKWIKNNNVSNTAFLSDKKQLWTACIHTPKRTIHKHTEYLECLASCDVVVGVEKALVMCKHFVVVGVEKLRRQHLVFRQQVLHPQTHIGPGALMSASNHSYRPRSQRRSTVK